MRNDDSSCSRDIKVGYQSKAKINGKNCTARTALENKTKVNAPSAHDTETTKGKPGSKTSERRIKNKHVRHARAHVFILMNERRQKYGVRHERLTSKQGKSMA